MLLLHWLLPLLLLHLLLLSVLLLGELGRMLGNVPVVSEGGGIWARCCRIDGVSFRRWRVGRLLGKTLVDMLWRCLHEQLWLSELLSLVLVLLP